VIVNRWQKIISTRVNPQSSRSSLNVFFNVYETLMTPQSTRLVTIHPGKSGSPIECSIRSVDSTASSGYIALSYVWGDPNNTREIQLNGQPFLVTKNLYKFLHYLRSIYHHYCCFDIHFLRRLGNLLIGRNSSPCRHIQNSDFGDPFGIAIFQASI
jgi:hypothetical protein